MQITQDSPQREHGVTGTLRLPKKYIGGCDDPDLYMAPTVGDCLVPEINPGDTVIASPAAAPEPGDFVIIWLKKGKPKVKRLVFRLPPIRVPAPGSDSNVMPALVLEQINPKRTYWMPMDKVRAVHKVIGTIIESAEPGWREDGLYSYDWGDGLRALDWIKVKTKKGALRKEPRGAFRYDGADGHLARQVTLRLFESSVDLERLAQEARS